MNTPTTEKQNLRTRMREERKKLTAQAIQEASLSIEQKVLELAVVQNASSIGCYMATAKEVQTANLIKTFWNQSLHVAIPAFDTHKEAHRWAKYPSDTTTHKGPFGIWEPSDPTWQMPPPPIVFIPGLAFDRQGHRLGYGKGHFDQLLSDSPCTAIGLAFSFQVFSSIPTEPHDISMQAVMTEDQDYYFLNDETRN